MNNSHLSNNNQYNVNEYKNYVWALDRCPLIPEYYNPMYLWSDAFNDVVYLCTPKISNQNFDDFILKHYYLVNYQGEFFQKINDFYFSITGIHFKHLQVISQFFHQYGKDASTLKSKFIRRLLSNSIYITAIKPYIYVVNVHLGKIDKILLSKYHQNELDTIGKLVIDKLLKYVGNKIFKNLNVLIHPRILGNLGSSKKTVLDKISNFSIPELFFPHIDEKYKNVYCRMLSMHLGIDEHVIQELREKGKIYDRTKYFSYAPLPENELIKIMEAFNGLSLLIKKHDQNYNEFQHILNDDNSQEDKLENDSNFVQQKIAEKLTVRNFELLEDIFEVKLNKE
ncbi:MAG: hypothetical protein KatS3mg027_2344 [Bacteroidia bacterium]|nr:MAG: hypothetical protein KatS3mg027_2344 [Bacteroidia bacterium]